MLTSNDVEDGRRGSESLLMEAETDTGRKVSFTAGMEQTPIYV